ncbi:hypothetical protein EXIGLDRAFT_759454 [Exidia glandulosa HHB12029]|uniref:Dynamin N-terminal domain-containing protein n=1 Tax=Exidia glandulosa HHB12029 TaxID=1314781 RepID=A0A165PVX1_EXIGL|nr:hypothetical protein EXIGLDRAFT_759454 [Exidia glandulosa HHB12029]
MAAGDLSMSLPAILQSIERVLDTLTPLPDSKVTKWYKDLHACADEISRNASDPCWLLRCAVSDRTLLVPSQTVIAFIGAMGSGKSSLINAIMGDPSLLGTSGLKSCTAMPIEISYQPQQGSTATIEYCSREHWLADIERLRTALSESDIQ